MTSNEVSFWIREYADMKQRADRAEAKLARIMGSLRDDRRDWNGGEDTDGDEDFAHGPLCGLCGAPQRLLDRYRRLRAAAWEVILQEDHDYRMSTHPFGCAGCLLERVLQEDTNG